MRPGINVVISAIPPQRSAPTNTGVWFVAGMTEKGVADAPIALESMADYARLLGARVSYGFLYDALDQFFREGGNRAYVMRVVGPAAIKALRVFNDAGAAATLTVRAKGPGDYANTQLKAAILAPLVAGFRIQITDGNNVVLELSPDLATKAEAFAWAQYSQYIELVDGASQNIPAVNAGGVLATGADDRAAATDANWKTALDRATPGFGPGQVSMPGRTTTQAHLDQLLHASVNNRTAYLDGPDTPTQATLVAAAAAARAGNQHFGAMFAPWITAPGVVAGTIRTIPPSALAAARTAVTDSLHSPNQPAAGDLGQSVYAQGVSYAYDDPTREALNNAGVNVIRDLAGIVTIYGWRSLANPASEATWLPLGHQRVIMGIAARAAAVMDRYTFKQIDGQRRLQGRIAGALAAELLPWYEDGALYGASASQAFAVDTGPTVNTELTLSQNELRAVIQVRPSPFAEMVTITIVKTPITEEVS